MATSTMARGHTRPRENVDLRRIPLATLAGAAVGSVANVAILLIGRATGAIGDNVAMPNGPAFDIPAVIAMTIAPAILAGILFSILGAIGRIRRPIALFRIVALGILALSLLSPFSIPGVGAGFVACLVLMHLAAAASIVWSLTTLARR